MYICCNSFLKFHSLGGNYINIEGMHYIRDLLNKNREEGSLYILGQTTFGRVPMVPLKLFKIDEMSQDNQDRIKARLESK